MRDPYPEPRVSGSAEEARMIRRVTVGDVHPTIRLTPFGPCVRDDDAVTGPIHQSSNDDYWGSVGFAQCVSDTPLLCPKVVELREAITSVAVDLRAKEEQAGSSGFCPKRMRYIPPTTQDNQHLEVVKEEEEEDFKEEVPRPRSLHPIPERVIRRSGEKVFIPNWNVVKGDTALGDV
ncbi:hypothetical protein NE237_020490 [Protea cynaroides]|uniref:Uncharacterized protein n=1 Tax=Protea cynaroides TaxID=273540 RepID=A0A9Q0H9H5_9MAGN|nr:hypothetical protein NE237_020490 [Protea cynaroides]